MLNATLVPAQLTENKLQNDLAKYPHYNPRKNNFKLLWDRKSDDMESDNAKHGSSKLVTKPERRFSPAVNDKIRL